MLLKQTVLEGIVRGEISLVFRRWKQARVKPGTRLRTSVGVLEVVSIEVVDPEGVSEKDAKQAGKKSTSELLAELDRRGQEPLHRIQVRFAGADPRVGLRNQQKLSETELQELVETLKKMDQRSKHGPWTKSILELIQDNPGVRAVDLATRLNREKAPFKRDVRRLKELGLTESLEIGYRLSPRGRSLVEHLSP
jgi:hypothetical protein